MACMGRPQILKALSYLIKGVLIVCLVVILVPLTDTALHAGLYLCPHTLSTFDRSEIIPVVYGLPTEEMYQKAKKGKIAISWCVLRLVY